VVVYVNGTLVAERSWDGKLPQELDVELWPGVLQEGDNLLKVENDENGPGAVEAGAVHYIDRALGDALASSRNAYASGLAAVDAYAGSSKGATFARLEPQDQDTILSEMETGTAGGFTPDSSTFFELVRTHTIEGTFCDPFYGGNANFIGWDLIGYPGVRIVVTAEQQRLDVAPRPVHRSAYDFERFVKEVRSRDR